MQEACMQHVLKLKVSAFDLEERQLTWILLKKSVQILRRPALNEIITIETHPSGFEKILAYRDFKCFDNQGKLIATGASCWGLLNTQTKQLIRFPKDIAEIKSPDIDYLNRPNLKISPFKEGELIMQHTVNQSDVDWNKHLNNAQLNKLILANISHENIKNYHIQFKHEALLNEDIQIYIKREDSGMVFKVWSATKQRVIALARHS